MEFPNPRFFHPYNALGKSVLAITEGKEEYKIIFAFVLKSIFNCNLMSVIKMFLIKTESVFFMRVNYFFIIKLRFV